MNALKSFINTRSKREIFLFKILWICGCFFVCFEYFIYPSILKFQAYKHSTTLKNPYDSQEIQEFFNHLNSTTLTSKEILEVIKNHTQSNLKLQDCNPTLCFEGTIKPREFFPLLQALASPTLLIVSFSLDSQGNLSLTLKNQKISSLSAISPLKSTPKDLFDKFSLPTLSSLSFYTPPKPKITLTLEAIFNQKAKINGVWIGLQESIQGYVLKEIDPHHILLQKDSQTLKLYLKEKRIFQ